VIHLRDAEPGDAELVLRFVRELATYEREPDAVEVDAATLRAQLAAERPPFSCVIAEVDGEAVGFALWFSNYSTWRGRVGVHLEDLYVTPARRGTGAGSALLREVARRAVETGAVRLEWNVLDWNEPAIAFYRAVGAEPLGEWTTFRLADEALARLARG
jgi:GNAT superfamily N-acetyltransferase